MILKEKYKEDVWVAANVAPHLSLSVNRAVTFCFGGFSELFSVFSEMSAVMFCFQYRSKPENHARTFL